MIVKIRMGADKIEVFDASNFTRKLVSPKDICNIAGYKDTVIVRIAEGLPDKLSKSYSYKNWKRITITNDKNTHILYTPNETCVLNDRGEVIVNL